MVFKATGVILLVLAAYLAFQSFALSPNDSLRTSYSLGAIFLVLVVRVLQAEKHHREAAGEQDSEQAHTWHAA